MRGVVYVFAAVWSMDRSIFARPRVRDASPPMPMLRQRVVASGAFDDLALHQSQPWPTEGMTS
jgi:hypothetical protein